MERILYVALLGLLGYLVYEVFSPFLQPLAWAVVLAIMFFPVHQRMREFLVRPNHAALASTLLLTVVIVVPSLLILSVFAAQAVEVVQWFQVTWQQGQTPLRELFRVIPMERVMDWLAEHNIREEDLSAYVTQKLEWLAGFVAGQAGRLARNVAVFIFNLFVTLFATFYLFRDGSGLQQRLRRALPLDAEQRDHLLTTAQNVLYASVFSGFVVAAVQGLLGGLTFWMLGIKAPVLWGTVMGFLSLLPVVGAWLVWGPALVVFLFEGDYLRALILLGAGVLIIGLADNILRPILISGRAQLNGLLVFVSILGGVAAFGLLGIVLGPIVVALGAAVMEAYTEAPVTPAPAQSEAATSPPAPA